MTNDDQPTDRPSPVNRPLTDEERALLHQLAIFAVAEQQGVDAKPPTHSVTSMTERGSSGKPMSTTLI
jgi:hypothetical protein